ncbi:hypothetical protein IW262DRAFT_1486931 [Armillaria fumosa]|nr:hypothetical protein IW262DRAFT_1486931 [Armillaria fumosa]
MFTKRWLKILQMLSACVKNSNFFADAPTHIAFVLLNEEGGGIPLFASVTENAGGDKTVVKHTLKKILIQIPIQSPPSIPQCEQFMAIGESKSRNAEAGFHTLHKCAIALITLAEARSRGQFTFYVEGLTITQFSSEVTSRCQMRRF